MDSAVQKQVGVTAEAFAALDKAMQRSKTSLKELASGTRAVTNATKSLLAVWREVQAAIDAAAAAAREMPAGAAPAGGGGAAAGAGLPGYLPNCT